GFKAPTFNDLYFPLSPPWFDYAGNPDLEPEKSRNIEAHLSYDTEDYWFSVTAYQNKVRKLINPYVCQEYFGPFCMFGRPENRVSPTFRGVSIAGGAMLRDTSIRVRAVLPNPRDDSTGNQLSRSAKQLCGADLEHRLQDWTLGA